jgi:hypothetical protein
VQLVVFLAVACGCGYSLWQLALLWHVFSLDCVTWAIITFNVAAVNTWAAFELKQTWPSRAAVVLLAWSLAWPFSEFSPTACLTTLSCLGLYDIVAVLTPCGPLRMIMLEHARHQQALVPALMYQGEWFELGLGDLIFYAVLVGRAAQDTAGDSLTIVCTAVGVFSGCIVTMLIVHDKGNAALGENDETTTTSRRGPSPPTASAGGFVLPALPVSLGLGLLWYFVTPSALTPLGSDLFFRQVVVS